MATVKEEIRSAVKRIGLEEEVFRELSDRDAESIFRSAMRRFVGSVDRRWWWEGFTDESVSVQVDNAFTRLVDIVTDPDEHIWFIVDDGQLPFFPVYEATTRGVQAVIGECYGFEYYLVAKDMTWLLCENHHGCLIGVGRAICDRLSGVRP